MLRVAVLTTVLYRQDDLDFQYGPLSRTSPIAALVVRAAYPLYNGPAAALLSITREPTFARVIFPCITVLCVILQYSRAGFDFAPEESNLVARRDDTAHVSSRSPPHTVSLNAIIEA